jgi:glycerol-3-phosphate acyltransferase PlsY
MMRNYGRGASVATLIGDMLKTVISVGIGALLAAEAGMYIAGLFSVIGHVFPVFFGFRGGKGVASAGALILCTEPVAFLILVFMFICIVAATKFLSLGSIMCMMMYPLVLNRVYMLIRDPAGVPFIPTLVSFLVMVLIVAKHKDNIQRLLKGTESKFVIKKSVKTPTSEEETVSSDKESK